jgi:hypothetical protein
VLFAQELQRRLAARGSGVTVNTSKHVNSTTHVPQKLTGLISL